MNGSPSFKLALFMEGQVKYMDLFLGKGKRARAGRSRIWIKRPVRVILQCKFVISPPAQADKVDKFFFKQSKSPRP